MTFCFGDDEIKYIGAREVAKNVVLPQGELHEIPLERGYNEPVENK